MSETRMLRRRGRGARDHEGTRTQLQMADYEQVSFRMSRMPSAGMAHESL